MPTPLGHALAGATVAWMVQYAPRTPPLIRANSRLAIICAEVAIAPDLDFIYPPVHRMMSHSIIAVVAVGVIAALVARHANRTTASWPVAILCGLAYGSHLALDWLGGDTRQPAGLQLLWPFSYAWFISSWDVFGATTLGQFFLPETILSNARTILREVFILGPVALVAWYVRRVSVRGKS